MKSKKINTTLAFSEYKRYVQERQDNYLLPFNPTTTAVEMRTRRSLAVLPEEDEDTYFRRGSNENGDEFFLELLRRSGGNLARLDAERQEIRYPKGYLQVLLNYFHKAGLSLHNYETGKTSQGGFREITHVVWNASAMTYSLVEVKTALLRATWATTGNDVGHYIRIGDTVCGAIFRLIFMRTLDNNVDEITEAIQSVKTKDATSQLTKKLIVTGLFGSGLLLAGVEAFLPMMGHDFSHFLEVQGKFAKAAVSAWSYQAQQEIVNGEGSIGLEPGVRLIIGWTYLGLKLVGKMMDHLGVITVITNGLTLYKPVMQFTFVEDKTRATYRSVREAKKKYEGLQDLSNDLNDSFETLTRGYLAQNLFKTAVLVNGLFTEGQSNYMRVFLLIVMLMCFGFLYMAYAIAKRASKYRSWAKTKRRRSAFPQTKLDLLLEEMSPDSVGIGTGALYVSDAFLLGYCGLILTHFYGIVETRSHT